jgi:hypothetical protein
MTVMAKKAKSKTVRKTKTTKDKKKSKWVYEVEGKHGSDRVKVSDKPGAGAQPQNIKSKHGS